MLWLQYLFARICILSLAGSGAVFGTWLICQLGRRLSCRWRYRIWLLPLILLLLPVPVLHLNLSIPEPEILPTQPPVQRVESAEPTAPSHASDVVSPAPALSSGAPQPLAPQSSAAPEVLPVREPFPVFPLLSVLWCAGALIYLLRKCRQSHRLHVFLRRNTSEPEPWELDVLNARCSALKISRPPVLRRYSARGTPFLTGLFRPTLCLPETPLREDELAQVLTHELIHLRRHDLWLKRLSCLVRTLHWFNPFVWLLEKQLDYYCELSCDEQVVAHLSQERRAAYGLTLIKLMRGQNQQQSASVALSGPDIQKRIKELTIMRKTGPKTYLVIGILTLVLCIGGVLFASQANRLSPDAPSEETDLEETGLEETDQFSDERYEVISRVVNDTAVQNAVAELIKENNPDDSASTKWAYDYLDDCLRDFAPYAKKLTNAVSTYQGIEVQVLSVLADELGCAIYFTVRDSTGNRVDETLELTGSFLPTHPAPSETFLINGQNELMGQYAEMLSFNSQTKTALFSQQMSFNNRYALDTEPYRTYDTFQLNINQMVTGLGKIETYIPGPRDGEILESIPFQEDSVIIQNSWRELPLPEEHVVLAPGQNSREIWKCEDMYVSSMGFAEDGCYHLRLEYAEGILPESDEEDTFLASYVNTYDKDCHIKSYDSIKIVMDDAIEYIYPLLTPQDLDGVQSLSISVRGTYIRPETKETKGTWTIQFPFQPQESITLNWTGKVEGTVWTVTHLAISPFSVIVDYTADKPNMFFDAPLKAVLKDGSVKELTASIGDSSDDTNTGYRIFRFFPSPVDLDEIDHLVCHKQIIPMN